MKDDGIFIHDEMLRELEFCVELLLKPEINVWHIRVTWFSHLINDMACCKTDKLAWD